MRISASIGISQTDDPAADPVTVVAEADVALYQAKALGKARSELFDVDLSEFAEPRERALETQLRRAIEQAVSSSITSPWSTFTSVGKSVPRRWCGG